MSEANGGDEGAAERRYPHEWLNLAPDPGAPELEDTDIQFPLEPPHVTIVRNLDGGPYILAPDSTEWVPPDTLAVSDEADVVKATERNNDRQTIPTTDGKVKLPREQEAYLKTGGQAAHKLLETLERGLEAATPELKDAVEARRRNAGLL